MSFGTFIEQGWTDHAGQADDVAGRLEHRIGDVASTDDARAALRLAVHVMGEHLGQWERGERWLDALARHCVAFEDAELRRGIARARATLRVGAGRENATADLMREDAAAAYAGAAAALAGRSEFSRSLGALAHALQLAGPGLPAQCPALRALAVAGNNIAVALEEKPDRTAEETAGMVQAARTGLRYWREAGTWLEIERAEYRLASSLLCAGDAAAACDAARGCLDLCEAHDAPALERFFGHEVLARARRAAGDAAAAQHARAAARAAYAALPMADRPYCDAAMHALESTA